MLATAVIIDDYGQPVTGGGAYFAASVKRLADGYLLDFADGTFKGSGWTAPTSVLSEYTDLPGTYYLDLNTAAWADGQYQAHFLFNGPEAARVGLVAFLVEGGKEITDYLGAAVGTIPTNPVLTSDARLNNLDAAISTRTPESGGNVAAIKAKTDNLPADPASNTQVNTRLSGSAYTAPDNAGISAIKTRTDNLPADPADQSLVEAAISAGVSPLAREANVQAHVTNALNAYDPPTRAELSSDIAGILSMVSALENISVADILAAPLGDGETLGLNSLGDLVRKLYWLAANRLVVLQADGSWTLYKGDGITPAIQGSYTRTNDQTERSEPQWP